MGIDYDEIKGTFHGDREIPWEFQRMPPVRRDDRLGRFSTVTRGTDLSTTDSLLLVGKVQGPPIKPERQRELLFLGSEAFRTIDCFSKANSIPGNLKTWFIGLSSVRWQKVVLVWWTLKSEKLGRVGSSSLARKLGQFGSGKDWVRVGLGSSRVLGPSRIVRFPIERVESQKASIWTSWSFKNWVWSSWIIENWDLVKLICRQIELRLLIIKSLKNWTRTSGFA